MIGGGRGCTSGVHCAWGRGGGGLEGRGVS